MKAFIQEADSFQDDLVIWRRHLHQNPETGMNLPNTAAFVKQKLEEMGYRPTLIAGHGVTALAGGNMPGKCILIRADMDALPIAEEADVPFKSVNGCMHACGHDFHTAMLLGAARLLKTHEDEIKGTVKLMFQPAEETLGGAKAMVEAGILKNPKVDAAAMFHVATGMSFPTGLIIVPGAGAFSSASDWFEIHIKGKGGHGAMPETAIDPLNVISHIHIALQAIQSREVAAKDVAIVTVGMMQGGEASNVIPDTATMKGTIRTYAPEVREFTLKRVPEIAENIATAFRAEVEPSIITRGCPSVVINGEVADDIRSSLSEVFGDTVPDPSALDNLKIGGSEDFSYVTEQVPGVMMMISAGSTKEGYVYPMHHPKARFNEEVLARGAAAYAVSAMGWLKKNTSCEEEI